MDPRVKPEDDEVGRTEDDGVGGPRMTRRWGYHFYLCLYPELVEGPMARFQSMPKNVR